MGRGAAVLVLDRGVFIPALCACACVVDVGRKSHLACTLYSCPVLSLLHSTDLPHTPTHPNTLPLLLLIRSPS